MEASSERNISTLVHLSTLTQYFIPFGNYIFPIILWSAKKNDSEFIDYNGKQVLNFQLSMLLYSLILGVIAVPIIIYTVLQNLTINDIINENHHVFNEVHLGKLSGFAVLLISAIIVFGFMKIMEFILIIYASVKTSNGERYKYPLTISFFK
ncbi:MAG: DUF4870 domain-containing protein [Flavobacterium sp.]|nr:DUF4870 domain-containing protein [Flavobacterium sp.]